MAVEAGVLCRAENLCLCGPHTKAYNRGHRQLNSFHGFHNLSREGKDYEKKRVFVRSDRRCCRRGSNDGCVFGSATRSAKSIGWRVRRDNLHRLKVVNAEGITRVELFDNEDGGGIWIVGEDLWEARLNSGELSVGNRREWTTLHREGLWVLGKDGGSVQLVNTAQGGRVSVDDNVVIDATEHGGRVTVFGKGSDESRAVMKSGEHGGSVIVFGKGDSKGQAGMGVNEYGNGGVSTWDKNGYRLTILK